MKSNNRRIVAASPPVWLLRNINISIKHHRDIIAFEVCQNRQGDSVPMATLKKCINAEIKREGFTSCGKVLGEETQGRQMSDKLSSEHLKEKI